MRLTVKKWIPDRSTSKGKIICYLENQEKNKRVIG